MIDQYTVRALRFLGFVVERDFIVFRDKTGFYLQWLTNSAQPSDAEMDAAKLPGVKADVISSIRTEARTRIESVYPEWRQRSAALGVYPAEYVAQMQAGIAAVIAASNAGEDAVDAAVDVAAVEAVTVTWPVI